MTWLSVLGDWEISDHCIIMQLFKCVYWIIPVSYIEILMAQLRSNN